MELEDISQVLEVDRESYTLPWPASAYRREILHNRNARYIVLRHIDENARDTPLRSEPESKPRLPLPFFPWGRRGDDADAARRGRILGYAGMWLMVDEAHITTIAVRESWRGKGLGELLLASLMEAAADMGADKITLEVRVSNGAAQNLYRKYGFQQEGLRARYYSDNNEDAFIMSTGSIQDATHRERFDELVTALQERLVEEPDLRVVSPAFSDTGESDRA